VRIILPNALLSPLRPEIRSPFVASGPAIRGRGGLGVIRMTQIAPTRARWLDVGLSPRAGSPINTLVGPVPARTGSR